MKSSDKDGQPMHTKTCATVNPNEYTPTWKSVPNNSTISCYRGSFKDNML